MVSMFNVQWINYINIAVNDQYSVLITWLNKVVPNEVEEICLTIWEPK